MADLNLHASPEFLNQLDWQLRRLALFIEMLEGLSVSMGDLHEVLDTLTREAEMRR